MFSSLKTRLKSTFLRYVVSYLLITAVLVGGIGIYMYSYYSKDIYSSTLDSETALMYQTKYLCDGYFDLLDSAAQRSDLSSVHITRDGDEKLFVFSGTLPEGLYYSGMSDTELKQIFSDSQPRVIAAQDVTFDGESGEYLTLTRHIAGSRTLVCLLPVSSLRLITEGESNTAVNRYIVYNGKIAASAQRFDIDSSYVERMTFNLSDRVTDRKRLSGQDYLFIALPGGSDGVSYVSVLTLGGIRAHAASVWLGFAAVLMLFALPCIGFMLFISRRNARSIQELGRRFGETGGDDISAISRGISSLSSAVNDSLPARRHMFVKSLVRGAFDSRESAINAGSEVGLDVARAYYALMLIDDRDSIPVEAVTQCAPEGTVIAQTDLIENRLILVLAFTDERQLLTDFAQALIDQADIKRAHACVAVSAVHDSLDSLPTAYLEASGAYESRFIMGDTRLLRFTSIPSGENLNRAQTERYILKIQSALSSADTQALDESLKEFRDLMKGGDMTLFGFRLMYNKIISAIVAEAGEEHSQEMYDLFKLSDCRSVDELDGILTRVCREVIASRAETGRSAVEDLLKLLIARYTDSEFSITSATELTGANAAKLSQEFKTSVGMTAQDYLTMLRMEQAKKLLIETELSVRDVASGSGYTDASSFTRRFKQYTGNTPLQYRQSIRSGETLDN